MATGNGYFDESVREAVVTKIGASVPGDAIMRTYGAVPNLFNAVLQNNATNLAIVEDGNELRAKVLWTESDDDAVLEDGDVLTSCEPSTIKPGSYSQTYDLTKKFGRNPFEVEHYKFKENYYGGDAATVIAQQLVQADYYMAQAMNAYVYSILNANFYPVATGDLIWNPGAVYTGGASGIGVTLDSNGMYPSTLYADMMTLAEAHNINGAFVVGGAQLHNWKLRASTSAGFNNTDQNRIDLFPNVYADIKGFASVPNESFLVSPTSYALAVRNYFDDTRASQIPGIVERGMTVVPSDKGERKHFTVPSRYIPGLLYDVTNWTKCISNGNYSEVFQVGVSAQMFMNPKSINEVSTNTGILKFLNAADIS